MTPKNEKLRKILAAVGVPLRVYIGAVFIAASLFKIYEPYDFALSVATYQMTPLPLINIFALALPWVELFSGVLLIVGFWTRANALLISAMMLMFICALSIALSRGLQMSCGCFASQDAADEIGLHTLLRDAGWLTISLYVLIFDDGRFGLDGLLAGRRKSHA